MLRTEHVCQGTVIDFLAVERILSKVEVTFVFKRHNFIIC
jgi:hypothetical protein